MVDTAKITRYKQFQQILDRAAAGSSADYDGLGDFWNKPLSQLLELELHGIRLIAPAEAPVASCCHGGSAESAAESRSAKSGLVRGLRGQAPFDGSQYPQLPWGGQTVPADEIVFIADWIDDGCPAGDHQTSFEVAGTTTTALGKVEATNVEAEARNFEVYAGSPNEYTYKYGELKQRMNLDCMAEPELEKLRWAFRELYRFNKWPEDRRSYNNMALIHQNHCQHGWERFLPWHRVYIYEMEQALQDVCPGVTMPYWDWTMPQYCPRNPEQGSIIPPAYKAYLTEASIEYLEKEAHPHLPHKVGLALLKQMVKPGLRYSSQATFFAAVEAMTGKEYTEPPYRQNFIKALLDGNSLWYPLRYPSEYHKPGTNVQQKINTSIFHYQLAVRTLIIPLTRRDRRLRQSPLRTEIAVCGSLEGDSTQWMTSLLSQSMATC